MKRIIFTFFAFLCIVAASSASNDHGNQLYQNVQRNFKEHRPATFSIFNSAVFENRSSKSDGVDQAVFMQIDPEQLRQLFVAAPATVKLLIPSPTGSGNWTLEVYRTQILTEDFSIKTSDGKTYQAPQAVYYQGILNNDPQSMAVISIFEQEVMGMLSDASGNYDLGLYGSGQLSNYVLYRSNELSRKLPFDCHTAEADIPAAPVESAAVVADCRVVRVYLECDFDLYTKRTSSIPNVTTFVTGFFNQVAAIYTNESLQTQISEIFVWTSTDPFISQISSGNVLSTFRTTRTTFNGNVAHLLSTRSSNMGGIAYLDVLCATNYSHAFSNIYNSYNNFPTYSWTVNVFTHEMGHNLGSNHTQWCGWTGGALDNCYTTEGGCVAGPAPVNGGTIMSYCHITSYGVNLANGFGTQPGNKIRTRYQAATCVNGGLTLSISPATATICPGSSISLTASGGGTYVWTPTTGLNVSTLATVAASPTANTTYTASSTVNNCTATASRLVTVLSVLNTGTLASGNQTFSGSGDPAAIAFSTSPSGSAGTFSYQWYSRAGIQAAPTGTSTTGWTAISGATAATYDPSVVIGSVSYAATVNPTGTPDCGGATWATGVRQITVNATTVFNAGTLAAGNQSFCTSGGDPGLISFTTAASGAASYSYQWYYQDGLIAAPSGSATTGWTLITGATSSSYDPAAGLTQSRSYACLVTPSTGTSSWAAGVRQMTILPAFNPGAITSGDQNFCISGNPANITMSVNPVGSGGYTWRWYYKESSAIACPTGSSAIGWLTNSTSANITGTTLTGAGISFDPISAGSVNNGRTFAVLVTPIANGSIPACGTAQWASSCRKLYVTTCTGALPGEEQTEAETPADVLVQLGQSFPNPTTGSATIQYALPENMKGASLVFYDKLGRSIAVYPTETGAEKEVIFNSEELSSGTYYYSLELSGTKLLTKKLILIN